MELSTMIVNLMNSKNVFLVISRVALFEIAFRSFINNYNFFIN